MAIPMPIKQKNHLFEQSLWTSNLKIIKQAIHCSRIRLTTHVIDSLHKRNLQLSDVLAMFQNGTAEIIQKHDIGTYPFAHERYNTEVLYVVYGQTNTGEIVHVVISMDLHTLMAKIITAYIPSLRYFELDYKTLRTEYAFKPVY